MRIDSHQHFWKYNPIEYGWIDDTMAVLRQDFLPDDLASELAMSGLDGSVAVQARQSLEETEWLLDLSDKHDIIKGVVGWVDLRSPDLVRQLDSFAGNKKLVGVRHVVQDEPDDRFLLREDFMRGVGELTKYDLVYDILIFERQLPAALEFVKNFPDQPFVLDHIAKPKIKAGELEPWAENIKRLARFENVFCKVSGMVTEADWHNWSPGHFRPYLDVVFEAFGASRIMFGSDWPVCTVAASYGQVFSLVEDYISGLSPDAREAILGINAAKIYGL